jgi:hypothetical protein
MPFEITNQGDFLFGRFYGVITAADLDRLATEVEVMEDSIPTAMDRISDLTAVDRFEVGYPAIFILAARRRLRQFTKPVKSAIIVQDPVQFGLARMFQTLNDNPQIAIQILHSVTEAKKWFTDGREKGTKPEGETS